jgi:hypothetical protein
MRRLALCLAVVVVALVVAPVALADGGPIFATQGGTGVASAVSGLHYVAVSDRAHGTLLETVDVANRGIFGWARFHGTWGIPVIGSGYASGSGQGLSGDGRTLVLESLGGPYVTPSKFLVVDARRLKPCGRSCSTVRVSTTCARTGCCPGRSPIGPRTRRGWPALP